MTQVVAIIPARGGSKGIPRKNLQEIGGVPLVGHAVRQSLSSLLIDRTIVSTEDDEIREVAAAFGAETMDRPDEFIHDTTVQEVDRLLQYTVGQVEKNGRSVDHLVLLYPTAPLREVNTIEQAVLGVTEGGFDAVLSVYEDTSYIWERTGLETVKPVNYDPTQRGPRQMEDWNQFVENKAVYAMKRDLLMNTGCRLGGKIGYVRMPKWRSIDIDKPADLDICRLVYEYLNGVARL